MSTTATPADQTRPVHRDPTYHARDRQAVYIDQEPASAHWDLAFGCALSFGPSENGGPLRVSIHMSDREAAAAMCVRTVTRDQVRAYARMLLRLVGEEAGPVRCRTNGVGHYPPATVLIHGEPRCGSCANIIDPEGTDRQPLPHLVSEASR